MKYLILVLLLFSFLYAQNPNIIESLESAYQKDTLTFEDKSLNIHDLDSNSVRAAKNYYQAVLSNDIQYTLLSHSLNFTSYPTEYYGQLSGIQLISIDFINNEYDKAILKIEKIDIIIFPEVIYWRAKIAFALEKYDEAIQLGQLFLKEHQSSKMAPQVWLVIFESLFYKKELNNFERNLETFSKSNVFNEYRPYLLFLHGHLSEFFDIQKSKNIYAKVIAEYPTSQFRVQAEDRLFALRVQNEIVIPPLSTPFKNKVVNKYEDLTKGGFYIQFGVFASERVAKNYVDRLNKEKIATFQISKPVSDKRMFAVIQGPYPTMINAQETQAKLDTKKYQSFVFKAE